MLDAQIRSAALRAAAKVAFSMMAAACGGVIESSEAPSGSSDSTPSDVHHAAGSPRTTPTGSQPQQGSTPAARLPHVELPAVERTCDVPAEGAVNESTELCCEDVIATEIPPEGLIDATALSADAVACCKVVVPFYDDAMSAGTTLSDAHALTWSQRSSCCGAFDPVPIGPTCTPWGPPLPPTMEGEVA